MAAAANDDDAGAPGAGGGEPGLETEAAALEDGRQLRGLHTAVDDDEGIAPVDIAVDGAGLIDAGRDQSGGAGSEAVFKGPIEVAVRREHRALRRGQDPMPWSFVAGVDDQRDVGAATEHGGEAAGVGAVGVQGQLAVAGAKLAQVAGEGVEQHHVAQRRTGPRPGQRQPPFAEGLASLAGVVVVVEGPGPGDDDVGHAVFAPEGDDVVDDHVGADDGILADEVQDRRHVSPG